MVDTAVSAGAEVIKHQTHIIDDEMSSLAQKTIPGNSNKSIYEIMRECSLNETDELELCEYVKSKGCIFISTPFSRKAAYRLKDFDIPAFKIGSGECNNYPLLELIASFGKPIILSTGMNRIIDIRKSVEIFRKYSTPFALLHTTNLYPTPIDLVRLGGVSQLYEEFPDAVVGLSDHTTNNLACIGAVALGASILERHYTDTLTRKGPDICCSMDPRQLTELLHASQQLQRMRGGDKTEFLPEEDITRDFAFSTVVSTKRILAGEKITDNNTWVKRPGIGEIPAEDWPRLIGLTVNTTIEKDTHIKWNQLNQ